MNAIIRNSIYFLGATFFAIYFSRFVGYTAQILAFWPIMLANATDHFILTRDILTYGVANLVWIMVFPSFIAAYIEYKNQRAIESDWKIAQKPKKEFVSVMEQVSKQSSQAESDIIIPAITKRTKIAVKPKKKSIKKSKKK